MNDVLKRLAEFFIVACSCVFRAFSARACRYHPSCSAYSIEAFRHASFFRALALSARRVLSCHPFSPGGYHPFKD